jgi:hypothetical protein
MATFADDKAILALDQNPIVAAEKPPQPPSTMTVQVEKQSE